jgi:DNA-binding PucR family transcriptional regulator
MEFVLPRSLCSIYHNNLIALITTDNDQFLIDDVTERLNKYLQDSHLVAGTSNRFSHISNLPLAYRQAILAIQEGCRFSGKELLYTFREYGFYRMFDLANEDDLLSELLDPRYIKLVKYDEEFRTEYSKTLYTYISCGQKSGKTALILGIHRNTIDYRIERIKELFNISFEGEDTLFSLLLSYRIVDYYHHIENGV